MIVKPNRQAGVSAITNAAAAKKRGPNKKQQAA